MQFFGSKKKTFKYMKISAKNIYGIIVVTKAAHKQPLSEKESINKCALSIAPQFPQYLTLNNNSYKT